MKVVEFNRYYRLCMACVTFTFCAVCAIAQRNVGLGNELSSVEEHPWPSISIAEYKRICDLWDSGASPSEKEQAVYASAYLYEEVYGPGCSWYCGGEVKKISSSSSLLSAGKNTYISKNAHDFDLETAWVEGVDGQGKGEAVTYTFDGSCPRITHVKIVNGYAKSQSAWNNNSRVKKLKMYYNGKPYAILNLKDTRAEQVFFVDTLGYHKKGAPDWTLKFEIQDVYPGAKYEDTAITELWFDGVDVH
jgi:hypothetical protein